VCEHYSRLTVPNITLLLPTLAHYLELSQQQNSWRGRSGRIAAAHVAQRRAFATARAVALAEARTHVETEFGRRESESGVPRMRWDAKIRVRQAKLRAAGDRGGDSRDAALQVTL
jgi:hypothetical protein